MKTRIEAADREKRMKERQAAKLLRKLQLADLRAKAGSRATGEERRKVERDKEAEERKRLEGEELERMSREEAAQLAGGDRCGSRLSSLPFCFELCCGYDLVFDAATIPVSPYTNLCFSLVPMGVCLALSS